jgi:biotin operon repressor
MAVEIYADTLKALGDPSRLRILGLLATRECSVEELASLLRLRAATVSHHLARLRKVGFVTMRADGTTHLYSLNRDALKKQNQSLTPRTMATLVEDLDADAWDRKVLRDFVEDGRLRGIPVQLKKRLVILRWLARIFEPGRRYTEKEVNELISQHHEDFATLRRYLVDHNLVRRERSIYWLAPSPQGEGVYFGS